LIRSAQLRRDFLVEVGLASAHRRVDDLVDNGRERGRVEALLVPGGEPSPDLLGGVALPEQGAEHLRDLPEDLLRGSLRAVVDPFSEESLGGVGRRGARERTLLPAPCSLFPVPCSGESFSGGLRNFSGGLGNIS
jgi:hypothetical protein